MNDFYPIVLQDIAAEVNDPQASQASCENQIAQALKIWQVALVQEKYPAFLIRKEGFDWVSKSKMDSLRQMSFTSLEHQSGDWQSSFALYHFIPYPFTLPPPTVTLDPVITMA